MEYGCIARKLGHSFSATIHGLIGGYDYRLCELPEYELDSFMKARDFKGINVTIPYKKLVIPYLDWMSDTAKRIGSVNTVVNRGGRLYGYNTDYFGMTDLLKTFKYNIAGKTVLILGTGGTSVTAHAVAEDLGSKRIVTVSRRHGEGVVTYSEVERDYSDAEIIINTTPVGMYPENHAVPIDIEKFPKLEALFDAIFNPLRSQLVVGAAKKGIQAYGGLYMLVSQAVEASKIFRDVKIDRSVTFKIYSTLKSEKENVVLTGMPGSGKSATGRIVASLMGREFVDIDKEIVSREGMEITEIFAQKGESGFRDIETEVIKEISLRTGLVIATGGGAVLRDVNVDALRQNGRIIFIDRDPEWLTPTADRPTASDREAIRKRYEERHDRYLQTCDRYIIPTDNKETNANMVLKELAE